MVSSKSAVAIVLLLASMPVFGGDLKFADAKLDPRGNVTFTYVLENLPLSTEDVFAASLDYLQKEYRTTKYKDVQTVPDKGVVYGKGEMNSFFTDNGLVSSEVFSAAYYLRLDAKEGKARIQLIFKNYDVQKLSDTSDGKTFEVQISSVAPFANGQNDGRFKKAFKALTENANVVLNSVVYKLKSVSSAPVLDEW